MIDLNFQLNAIQADFWHYVNMQPHNMAALRGYLDMLPIEDKEVLKDHFGKTVSIIEVEKFESFNISEEGQRLILNVGYKYKGKKGQMLSSTNVKALRINIQNNLIRKFIFYSLKDISPGKLGRGNILNQLQKLKIPRFSVNIGISE